MDSSVGPYMEVARRTWAHSRIHQGCNNTGKGYPNRYEYNRRVTDTQTMHLDLFYDQRTALPDHQGTTTGLRNDIDLARNISDTTSIRKAFLKHIGSLPTAA